MKAGALPPASAGGGAQRPRPTAPLLGWDMYMVILWGDSDGAVVDAFRSAGEAWARPSCLPAGQRGCGRSPAIERLLRSAAARSDVEVVGSHEQLQRHLWLDWELRGGLRGARVPELVVEVLTHLLQHGRRDRRELDLSHLRLREGACRQDAPRLPATVSPRGPGQAGGRSRVEGRGEGAGVGERRKRSRRRHARIGLVIFDPRGGTSSRTAAPAAPPSPPPRSNWS